MEWYTMHKSASLASPKYYMKCNALDFVRTCENVYQIAKSIQSIFNDGNLIK